MHKNKPIPSRLLEAYRNTDYIVSINDTDQTLNIEKPIPAMLRERIESKAIAGIAVITAYNPYSVACNDIENQRWQAQLQVLLSVHEYETLPALGVSNDGEWQEPGFAVLGISRELARAFGSCFRQNAIVYGEASSAVELVICHE